MCTSTTQLQAMIWALEKVRDEKGMMEQIIVIDNEGNEIYNFQLASICTSEGCSPEVFFDNQIKGCETEG